VTSRTFAVFCSFELFFAASLLGGEQKEGICVCDNLPRRQDGAWLREMLGVLKTHRIFKDASIIFIILSVRVCG